MSSLRKSIAILVVTLLSACASAHHLEDSLGLVNNQPALGDKKFVGEINGKQLLKHYSKFSREYDTHSPDPQDIKNFKLLKGNDIVVFFGVWCHDSQRELPRLLKLIEESKVELNSIKLVAINQQKEVPQAYQKQFSVDYTPTMFVVQQNQIIAKIVEKPKTTLTKDLLSQILH